MRIVGEPAMLALGRALSEILRPGDCIGLSGDLGVGKTTLARGVLSGLGLEGEAPSPSFAIVQPYAPPETHMSIAHVDLYRIDDPADIAELGLEEYRDEAAMLIEWPERLGEPWPEMLIIAIVADTDGSRALTATVPPAWEGRWPLP